jgi:LTXXQ motif family protein
MRTISTRVGAIALALAVLNSPPPAHAFGFRLGPLHVGLPLPGAHRHGRIARAEPSFAEPTENVSPNLIYPILAWPSLYDDIFWPTPASSWRYGYEDIFDQAFAKYPPARLASLCPYRDPTEDIVMRISRETMPTDAQKPALAKLAKALGYANGYLLKSCPTRVPTDPIGRLQLMEAQIDVTIMALNIVRPQLQAFAQALDDRQRAALDGTVPAAAAAAAATVADACKRSASASRPFTQLEQAVQPTDAQRQALKEVGDAFDRAAADLQSGCATAVPATALGRLEALEARLDASWRAVLTIEVALAHFQKQLSGEQNARFNALTIASAAR